MFVLIPLILLIVVSFICGYFLAKIEMDSEMQRNDEILRERFKQIFQETKEDGELGELFKDGTKRCVDEYAQALSNEALVTSSTNIFRDITRLQDFLSNCTDKVLKEFEVQKFMHAVSDNNNRETGAGKVTYNWIRCPLPNPLPDSLINTHIDPINESKTAANYYFDLEFQKLLALAQARADEIPGGFDEVYTNGIDLLTGHQLCSVNLGGGSFFWFTIMTTIGYGNATPVTNGGRAMVTILGFLCILLFTAVSTQAGYVSLAVADDFFKHHGMNRLQSGGASAVFWFVLYHLWNLVIAYIAIGWTNNRALNRDNDFMFLDDAFWFAVITSTTVGFGDYFFPHEIFMWYDMLYVPPILLIGFVLLANFIIKFGEWIWTAIEEINFAVNIGNLRESLEIKSRLEEQNRQSSGLISKLTSWRVPNRNVEVGNETESIENTDE